MIISETMSLSELSQKTRYALSNVELVALRELIVSKHLGVDVMEVSDEKWVNLVDEAAQDSQASMCDSNLSILHPAWRGPKGQRSVNALPQTDRIISDKDYVNALTAWEEIKENRKRVQECQELHGLR